MPNYIFTTDDKDEYLYAIHGIDFLLCLWDMDQWLRSKIKYSVDLPEGAYKALEEAREELRDIMSSHGVSLDMLR